MCETSTVILFWRLGNGGTKKISDDNDNHEDQSHSADKGPCDSNAQQNLALSLASFGISRRSVDGHSVNSAL